MHNHASSSYRILARNESLTGWISVVDELTPRYGHHVRALRAGHSLIGGIYVETGDSVFASFYLMEGKQLLAIPGSHFCSRPVILLYELLISHLLHIHFL